MENLSFCDFYCCCCCCSGCRLGSRPCSSSAECQVRMESTSMSLLTTCSMDPNNTSNESSSTIDGSVLPSILDGTSMAAASFQSGDKFLFYQAADGSIQFAAFSQSAKAWLSNSKLQLGPEFEQLAPKNGTPLSLVVLESWVYLLYVDTSNRIVQFGFTSDITESDGGTTNEPLPIPNAVMNPSSHSLSLTGALIGDYYHGLITFENDIGNISMWRTNQTVTGNGSSSDVIPFIDITNSLYAQLPPGASIAAPFVSALSQTANNTSPDEVAVDLAFLDPNATANSTLLLGTYYPNDHEVSLSKWFSPKSKKEKQDLTTHSAKPIRPVIIGNDPNPKEHLRHPSLRPRHHLSSRTELRAVDKRNDTSIFLRLRERTSSALAPR